MKNPDHLTIGLVQMTPVWLQREATAAKMLKFIDEAAEKGCELVVFSEALLPGYPFWVELTDGARFNSDIQKEIHAHYLDQAVQIEAGHLQAFCDKAKDQKIALVLGIIERPADRGGHSVYCSLVYIDQNGNIQSVHRKLMPTYEERLVWSTGDGHGLRVHKLGAFTIGGLNCWENWMPLPRAALYAMGEDLHISIWPGQYRNTYDIVPFLAKEGRSYSIAVCSYMTKKDLPEQIPHIDIIRKNAPEILADGGTCIAEPNGKWLLEPVTNKEGLFVATLDHKQIRRERQNFDPTGHYSRPDVTRLEVNRSRQGIIKLIDSKHDLWNPVPVKD